MNYPHFIGEEASDCYLPQNTQIVNGRIGWGAPPGFSLLSLPYLSEDVVMSVVSTLFRATGARLPVLSLWGFPQ